MKSAFTLVELIFTIIIIALLASIAIPRFNATKDDAKTSSVVTQLSDCIAYAGAKYTGTGLVSTDTINCKMAEKCFDITIKNDDPKSGKLIVKSGSGVSNAEDKDKQYCKRAYTIAERNSLSSSEGKEHDFGATHVVYDN